ncbi:MAG: [Fe-Fe] hydrogenase large subunit C-terminal domain-containing protein [Gemmatimonadaceae bacterium]
MTGLPGFIFLLHSTSGAERLPDAGHKGETGSDRSSAGAADPTSRRAPSLVILGADALLVAQPATAVQLAHACLRVGYHVVVPATWGDELIARGCLKHLASRRSDGDTGPAILCACPYVANRLLAVGPDLQPFLASFVPPPVAVARYLRTLYEPTRIRLTYVGRCPGAADDAIDARLSPDELLAVLAERGVDLAEQPRVFDSVIPPDRRRFLSQPGGLPSPDVLRRIDPERRVVEVTGPELASELTQHLLSRADVLIDLAPRLGCACSGAVPGAAPEGARAAVTALEPPRAASPVVDDRVSVPIELPLPAAARDPIDIVPAAASGKRTSGASRAVQSPDPQVASPAQPPAESGAPGGRRRSPTHGVTVRQPTGAIPTARSGEGRALPRAYVARRGAGSRGRGPSTPPRGEAAQRLDASGGRGVGVEDGGRAAERGSPRGGGMDSPPLPDRAERGERPERGERMEIPRPSPAASAVSGPSAEVALRSNGPRAVSATLGSAPDHAADPHDNTPLALAGETAAPEPTSRERPRAAAPDAAPEPPPAPASEPRGPSPISGASGAPAASFRLRTTAFARMAVGAARQRRTTVAALLAVALLSASVGVLAGRWLAARAAAAPAATTR